MNTLVPNIISLSQVKERRELCLVSATKTNRQNQTVLPRVLSLRRPLGKMHDGAGTSALREWLPSPSVSGNAPPRCPSVSSRISAASACTDPWAEEPQRTSRLNGPPAWKLQLFDAVVLGAGGQERDFCSTSATKLPAPSSQLPANQLEETVIFACFTFRLQQTTAAPKLLLFNTLSARARLPGSLDAGVSTCRSVPNNAGRSSSRLPFHAGCPNFRTWTRWVLGIQ